MGGTMSRDKGKRAEREVIALLQPVVTEMFERYEQDAPKLQRNTLQSDGGGFDIVGLRWMALEVKHQESIQVAKWWCQSLQQAQRAGPNVEPVLFYRKNNVKFRVVINPGVLVYRTNNVLSIPVDISVDDFLTYFSLRLESELLREIEAS